MDQLLILVFNGKELDEEIFSRVERIYVNPYLVLKSGSYTKHFYIEGQRIVSKLGDGLGDATNGTKAGNGTVSYGAKQKEAREAIVKNLKFLGQDGKEVGRRKSEVVL